MVTSNAVEEQIATHKNATKHASRGGGASFTELKGVSWPSADFIRNTK